MNRDITHQTEHLTRNIWAEIILHSQIVKCKFKEVPCSPIKLAKEMLTKV